MDRLAEAKTPARINNSLMPGVKVGLLMLLIAAAAAALVQVLALCLYAFPHADDYVHIVTFRDYSNKPLVNAAATLAWKSYLTWNARWATTFVHYLVIGSLNAYTQYPAPLILFALIHFIALIAFFAAVMEMRFKSSLFWALILNGVLLASMPSLNEYTYWLTSVIEYGFSISCCCLLFAFIRVTPRTWFFTVLLSIGVLFVAGQHEFNAVALFLIFSVVWGHQRSIGAHDRAHWLVLLIIAMVGLGIIAFAPGTRTRADTEILRLHGWPMIRFAAQQPLASFPRWISSPPFFLAILIWSRRVTSIGLPWWLRTGCARWSIPAVTAALALMAVLGAPVMSGYQAGRTIDWGYFAFVIGTLLSIAANRSRISHGLRSAQGLHLFATVSLACALVFCSNIELARRGLAVPLGAWRRTMIERIQMSSHGDVVLPYVTIPSPLLSHSGVLEDKDHWLNRAFAQFLYVRSIVPAKPCGPSR